MSRRVLVKLVMAGCLSSGLAVAGSVGFAAGVRTVDMKDQCDPATFDAAIGPGTCLGHNGGVSFDTFLAELTQTQRAGAWHFAPGVVRMRTGEAVQSRNTGGEIHTFTKVDEFAGGFVAILNELSGNPVPAPECDPVGNPEINFVPPGGVSDPEPGTPGVHHYQCCIHPWMRADVIVR
jgi:plastocyanin